MKIYKDIWTRKRINQELMFYKSSFSESGGCVGVAKSGDGTVKVKDMKNRAPHILTFTPKEWAAFIAGVKNGEFD